MHTSYTNYKIRHGFLILKGCSAFGGLLLSISVVVALETWFVPWRWMLIEEMFLLMVELTSYVLHFAHGFYQAEYKPHHLVLSLLRHAMKSK